MNSRLEIERAIEALAPEEYDLLIGWLEKREEERFDRKIEQDIRAGKLDALADQAIADLKAGNARDL